MGTRFLGYGCGLNYFGFKFLFLSVLVALAIQIYRKGWKRIDRPGVILIGVFMVLAMISARHTSLFAIVAGALIPGIFPLKWPYDLSRRPLRRLIAMGVNFALILVPFFTALIVLPGAGLDLEYPHVAYPVGAVSFLERQNIRGKLLVPFNYGSYALWELRGKMRVSMDGRYDLVYRLETYQRVDDFFSARRGLAQPPHHRPSLTRFWSAAATTFTSQLRNEPGWTEAWRDSYGLFAEVIVFVSTRDGQHGRALIRVGYLAAGNFQGIRTVPG
jgi:hypothetical protein